MIKKSILTALIILAAIALINFSHKNTESKTSNGQDFDYNFNLKDLDGNRIPFSGYKGKVVFLNMWATWCGPCRYEMPGIQKLYDKTTSNDIVFVMLSIDREGEQAKVAAYLKKNNYTFPAFMPSSNLTEQLNVPSIPTTFIIGKDGKIVQQIVGTTNFDTDKYVKLLNSLASK